MKGVIFNFFESFVDETYGMDNYESCVGEDDVFVGTESYDDEKFLSLFSKISNKLSISSSNLLREFGRFTIPRLLSKYEDIKIYECPENVLLELNDVIHVEVKKMMPNSNPPKFVIHQENNKMVVEYISERKLYNFVEGAFLGLADYFNCSVEYSLLSQIDRNSNSFKYEVNYVK